MPKITITKPFNYQTGNEVKHYQKGEQDVPQAVADHAQVRGYAAKAKAEKATEPAGQA